MPPPTPAASRATFIVRLWRDAAAQATGWRGEVVHVESERTTRASDHASLLAFISSELAGLDGREQEDVQHGFAPEPIPNHRPGGD